MENLLPTEINLDIFSRLPVESVNECRLVCKTWRNLLLNSSFAHMHLHRQLLNFDHVLSYQNQYEFNAGDATKLGLLLFTDREGDYGFQLCYLGYDENDDQFYGRIKNINYPLVSEACDMAGSCGGSGMVGPCHGARHCDMVGSCNGLICLSFTHPYTLRDPIHIFNPITREFVNLPRLEAEVEYIESMRLVFQGTAVSGFGYDPSSNEYKVVRIYYPREKSLPFVQVYTLGSGSGWRNKGKITYVFRKSNGILANGALHWLTEVGDVVAFNLVDEEFHLLPSLPIVGAHTAFYELRVLGGRLCVIYHIRREGKTCFWFFKNKYSNYDLKEQDYQSWYWNEEFSVACKDLYFLDQTFAITKKGEVLFWKDAMELLSKKKKKKNGMELFSYDPKTEATEKLGKLDVNLFNRIITHVNSFVSLQALGEEYVKIIGQMKEKEQGAVTA